MKELNCLETVIGLSTTTCACFDDDKPSDYNESQSSLFLDETPGLDLNLADAAADCQNGSLWDLMTEARTEGNKHFSTLFLNGLKKENKLKYRPWEGCIGEAKTNKNLPVNKSFAGLEVKMNNQKGGIWKLKKITTNFVQSGTFTLSIYNNLSETPIAQYVLTTVANEMVENNLPSVLELPMASPYCEELYYYFVYDTTNLTPRNSKLTCGCTGKKYDWERFIDIHGIKGNDLTKRKNWHGSTYSYGLGFCGSFTCDVSGVICTDDNLLDFENDAMAMQFAYGLRYKQAELLIEKILASGNLNRYTMMKREHLWGKRNHYRKTANEIIEYLIDGEFDGVNSWDLSRNDCLVCYDGRMKKVTIMS